MATKNAGKSDKETPLMKQYASIKAKYPDALLLFRVGDFYETFGEDAVKASAILGIVLTRRANGAASYVELAGFPHHSLDTYLHKLVRAGHRVAICDQLEDPKLTKTIVKRGVTELVTPGVSYNDKVLDQRENNFLAALYIDKNIFGISFLDVSTGEFYMAQGNFEYIDKLIQGFKPSEILLQKKDKTFFYEKFGERHYTYFMEDWVFTSEFTNELLLKHFNTQSMKGFGVEELYYGKIAAGAALHYLSDTQHDKVKHIASVSRIEEDKYVWLDKFTMHNLELFNSANENAKTLIGIIDKTISPMGSRMMKRWLAFPLKEKILIEERLDSVQFFLNNQVIADELRQLIKQIGDLERIVSKVSTGKISPKEVLQLKYALNAIAPLKNILLNSETNALVALAEQLNLCERVADKIEKEINNDAPVLVSKGNVINNGVNAELDELRTISHSGKDYLLGIQQRESERTGIPSLKVSFNNVFGYYLEVTNTHKDKVPSDWVRKQTLANAERYITDELKVYEEKILGADEKIIALETSIYNEFVVFLQEFILPVQLNAGIIAKIDCLLSFAQIALTNNYVRPHLNKNDIIDIKEGRHPVIEKQLPPGVPFITNDVYMDSSSQQIIIITGPNMSGKSALLRQVALIVLMAQIGSYVPAMHAEIGIVDKIFTRVGASDNISSGESTFMVEMNETASILNNIGSNSLILLDEIGRGTSTYDGISIAWAIVEYLHNHPVAKAKTLFATHYHELNDLENILPGVKNYNVSVKESENKIVFLRKLKKGGSEHSFGIHVARMAGIPKIVVERANEVLRVLEKKHAGSSNKQVAAGIQDDLQLSFFQLDDPVLEQIKEELLRTDVNTLTPVEALLKLNEIKKLIGS